MLDSVLGMEPVWLELSGGKAQGRHPCHYPAGCVTLDIHLTSLFVDPVQPLMSARSW